MSEVYQQVAFIGLRNPDGSYKLNVPLYIKVKETTKNGVSIMQEDLIHKVSEIMMNHYEKQLSEIMASKTSEVKNEKI